MKDDNIRVTVNLATLIKDFSHADGERATEYLLDYASKARCRQSLPLIDEENNVHFYSEGNYEGKELRIWAQRGYVEHPSGERKEQSYYLKFFGPHKQFLKKLTEHIRDER